MLGRRFTSERVRRERRKHAALSVGLWVLLLCAVAVLFVAFVRRSEFSVSRIAVIGNKVVSDAELFVTIESTLQGAYLGLIPRRFSPFLPTGTLSEAIMAAHPRVASVKIKRRTFSTLDVYIRERKPAALWCESEECFMMDAGAFVFAPSATVLGGRSLVRYSSGLEGVHHVPGEFALPTEYFHDLGVLQKLLEEIGIRTLAVRVFDEYIELSTETNHSRGTRDAVVALLVPRATTTHAQNVADLEAILSSEGFINEVGGYAALQTMDLRFGNKVFYTKKEDGTTIETRSGEE